MTNKENNKVLILQSAIIVLLIIIVILAFFMWKGFNNNNTWGNIAPNEQVKDLDITVIDDSRCTDCQTSVIVDQLKSVPGLSAASFETKDFSDDGVEQYLKDNSINTLPAIIFSHNNVDAWLVPYLTQISDWSYSLQVWSTFNPFAERSENGFLIVSNELVNQIKSSSYIKWNPDAKITWIEYSDLECPYCAKLHENGTPEDLEEKYGDTLNRVLNHFPLDFHANAMPGAQILECVWEKLWGDAFYTLSDISFDKKNSDTDFLIEEAVKLWADKAAIETCLESDKYKEKVTLQQTTWANNFGISGTPGNVLINNETWEYQVISGAYPTSEFVKIIDKLLEE